ncbi:MAG TPA: undecaprenyldiphospho-muramoylpentapeptide beta-N-acetylglucosaminyltransferase [Acetobacteraceae bacterium]|nr:undecaprenyldiphospho-muramoylpentapeptide beta-N-acetylglucosaminyltransferase [Acetobacteraceae bacterium]
MRGPASRPVVIAAGGTGGHFFPAEALAAELVARGHRVALMTDARTGARRDGVFAGREQFVIAGAGIAGRGAVRGLRALAALAAGAAQARAILRRLDPAVVVGFGGYPSVAPVFGARLRRRPPPTLLHEQNAVLGRANRFLATRADMLALGFADTARLPDGVRRVVTGNPVRGAIAALALQRYTPPREGALRLLVLGGSLGARVFSDVVPAALALLPSETRARLAVVQQARAEDVARTRAAYAESGIAAELAPFFPDVAERLAQAHLVIARAGASTVAELAVAGRPAILVPLPIAIDDHQAANARALAETGGAIAMRQTGFTPDALAEVLASLLDDPARLAAMAAAARAQGRPQAAASLADLVEAQMARVARP